MSCAEQDRHTLDQTNSAQDGSSLPRRLFGALTPTPAKESEKTWTNVRIAASAVQICRGLYRWGNRCFASRPQENRQLSLDSCRAGHQRGLGRRRGVS